jgi:hypothetical protein
VILYHLTYLFNLPSIQEHGLKLGTGEVFGKAMAGHARNRLFLTSGQGISFWAARLEQWALHNTDYPEEGWVPVVLEAYFEEDDPLLQVDEIGSRDAAAPAFYTTEPIAPEDISVWYSEEWNELDEVLASGMLEELLEASEEIEEDGESWWELDFDCFLPPASEISVFDF